MKSRACPYFRDGICPDTETHSWDGRYSQVFVVLPYCASEQEERAMLDVLVPTAGIDPAIVAVARTLMCRPEGRSDVAEHASIRHCMETRVAHMIRFSGARAVYACGRSAAEAQYPVPAFLAPDPFRDRAAPSDWLQPFFDAVACAAETPEICYAPSAETRASAPERSLIAAHVSGGLLSWYAGGQHVVQDPDPAAGLAALAEAAPLLVSWQAAPLVDTCPGIMARCRVVDLGARLRLSVRVPAGRDEAASWLADAREAICAADPDSGPMIAALLESDLTEDAVEESLQALGEDIRALVEQVCGPRPALGDAGLAAVTYRAWKIARDVLEVK